MTSTARFIQSLSAIGLLLLAGHSAHAKTTYKCKTGAGTVYTATPALGQQCSKMTLNGIAPPTQPTPAVSSTRQAPATTALGTEAATSKQTPATKADCDASRKAIDMLQSGQRAYETDDNGERRYLDDAQRTVRTQQHQQQLNTRCAN
jgi:hypothetical protein